MAKKKPTKISWDKSGKIELMKFKDYISHCEDFAETIAKQKSHPTVTAEDVADAIQKYAALWAGMTSKKKTPLPAAVPKTKLKKVPPAPVAPQLDEATEKRIDELKKFIKEEEGESADFGFGDPKARIAHWRKEIEELKNSTAK